jgi:hypothetical protein
MMGREMKVTAKNGNEIFFLKIDRKKLIVYWRI